jgi:hypothetical protein
MIHFERFKKRKDENKNYCTIPCGSITCPKSIRGNTFNDEIPKFRFYDDINGEEGEIIGCATAFQILGLLQEHIISSEYEKDEMQQRVGEVFNQMNGMMKVYKGCDNCKDKILDIRYGKIKKGEKENETN